MTRLQRVLAGVGIVGVSVVGAATLTLALLPGAYQVERSAIVHGSPADVQHFVSHFPDRLGWIPWTEQDPDAAYTFTGVPAQSGATMSWVGEEIGTATLTLDRVVPGQEVVSTLDYDAPFDMTSTDRFVLQDMGDGTTRVTWSSSADLPFGPGRLFGLFADGMLGPDYEHGLAKLDQLLTTNRS